MLIAACAGPGSRTLASATQRGSSRIGASPSAVSPPVLPTGPALRRCEQHPHDCFLSSRPTAWPTDVAEGPLASGATLLSRADAEAIAIGTNTPTSPTFSRMVTGSVANEQFRIGRASTWDESRPVWVVTVHALVYPSAVVPEPPQHVYSVVLDAQTGQITDSCTGCAWLTGS
jgi:hypothetical protein